ncbi:HIRAN protein [Thioalkalivibrio nitratireducens DSM 14787]|uniref:HIRAN protein n=1 Tax=Thioalkalivibrio nitratireducens (strain DSM 14787 / UNIQEM 213 / ALEN2) TaxID=1255043 RepID=L0E0E1_THIND|nr:HIRAN domain-containing protein [Thioalkalivibrio nitratireducens]AGA34101.1 HIRAN protein [Thioalkalivibrio nitratireducens DSM 14787]
MHLIRRPPQALRTPLLCGYTRRRRRPEAPPARYLQRLPLAGFDHHAAGRLWPYLRKGQALLLSRELSNPVDPRAVRITWLGEQLGYLPRVNNALAAGLLDRGARVIARIHTLRESRDPWARIDLDVYLEHWR